jgi:hypothetical protein
LILSAVNLCEIGYLEKIESFYSSSDFTQLCLINIWRIQLCLAEMKDCDDNKRLPTLNSRLKSILKQKESVLDKVMLLLNQFTVYQILQNYGRINEFLEFAEIKVY